MQNPMTLEQLSETRGTDVVDAQGTKIGTVEEIFYDEQTGQPEWIGIGTGFFGTKRVLVPIQGANFGGDGVQVPYSKDQVSGSPDIDGDFVDQDTERELYSYYGISYSEERSDTVLPEGGAPSGGGMPAGEASVTRSEEELRVGKRQVEAGQVRLRKWVETEPVSADVQLERETVRVERQPINEPVSGAEIGEDQIEVPLRAEEAVVQKEAVARERITLDKDVEVETQTVSDEVRKERVDLDTDSGTTTRR